MRRTVIYNDENIEIQEVPEKTPKGYQIFYAFFCAYPVKICGIEISSGFTALRDKCFDEEKLINGEYEILSKEKEPNIVFNIKRK